MTLVSGRRVSLRSRHIPCHLAKEPPCPAGSSPPHHRTAARRGGRGVPGPARPGLLHALLLSADPRPSRARARRRPAASHPHRRPGHHRPHRRVGRSGTGDLEPTRGHGPLLLRVLPAAPLAGRGPHRRPGAPAGADRPDQGDPLPELEWLWRCDEVGVREKALWRLLYETAARASEALSINVEDLELDNKRVRVRSKGRRHRLVALPDRLGAAAPAGGRCINCATRPSRIWPSRMSVCRC